jgi:hypothetical protein
MMSAHTVAVVGVRIIALWLLLEGTCTVVGFGLFSAGLAVKTHSLHRRVGPDAEEPSDVAYMPWARSTAWSSVPRFVLGGILLLSAKSVGRLIAKRLE